MKNKVLFIFTFLFVLLIGVNKINATTIYEDANYTVDERFIYNLLTTNIENFDAGLLDYTFCGVASGGGGQQLSCYFPDSIVFNKLTVDWTSSSFIRYKYVGSDTVLYISFILSGLNKGRFVYDYITPTNNYLSIYSYYYTSFVLPNPNNNSNINNANLNWTGIDTLDFSNVVVPEEPEEPEYQIEKKIYLPIELDEEQCPYILDKDTIRVYDEEPTTNSTVSYTDYFINSHYISKSGDETFENDLIVCLDNTQFTTSFYYRFDFHEIMIIFTSMLTIVYVIFGKILHSFFLGFRR